MTAVNKGYVEGFDEPLRDFACHAVVRKLKHLAPLLQQRP